MILGSRRGIMFTNSAGMLSPSIKNNPSSGTKTFPVLSANLLLADTKYQQLLENLKNLVSMSPPDFEKYYLKVIHHFAEFVQQLPETKISYYSHSAGILDHGLERAYLALSQCRAYFVPQESTQQELSAEQSLWCYAVFTAGLLADIGKVVTRHAVYLCERDGQLQTKWDPYSGSMLGQGKYYIYEFEDSYRIPLQNGLTPLLAYQLLTQTDDAQKKSPQHDGFAHGFAWIASNPDVLEAWFLMLNLENAGGGRIVRTVPDAQALLLAQQLNLAALAAQMSVGTMPSSDWNLPNKAEQGLNKESFFGAKDHTKEGGTASAKGYMHTPFGPAESNWRTVSTAATSAITGTIASSIAPTLTEGIAFFNWLKQALSSGKIASNKASSGIFNVNEGVLLTNQVFQLYASQNNKNASQMQLAQAQFHALELGAMHNYRDASSANNKLYSGVLVSRETLGLGVDQNAKQIPIMAQLVQTTSINSATPASTPNYSALNFMNNSPNRRPGG